MGKMVTNIRLGVVDLLKQNKAAYLETQSTENVHFNFKKSTRKCIIPLKNITVGQFLKHTLSRTIS